MRPAFFSLSHRCTRLLRSSFFFTQAEPPYTSPPQPPSPSLLPTPCITHQFGEKVGNQFLHSRVNDGDLLHYLRILSTVAETLLKNPRNFGALRTLDSMLIQACRFDSVTLVFVVHCLSKLKKLERAKRIIARLRSTGRVSDYFLFGLVLDYLVTDGKIDDTEIVWDEICGFEPSIPRIDVSDYVIYLSKFGGVCEIRRICERILPSCRILKKQSYTALIGALCRVKEGLLAKEVVQYVDSKGLEIDDLTYFVMFKFFCRNGDLDEADLILRKLVKRNYQIDICIYGNFISGLCRTGKHREANKLFRKLIETDCCGGSKVDFLKKGKRAIFQLNCKGAVPEIMAYETYFRSLCSVGRLDLAEMLLKKMKKKRYVLEICVYGSFIKALFQANREDDVMKFYNIERKKGIVQVDEIARFIIMGLCEKGKVDQAFTLFSETITSVGFVYCMDICNFILAGYWKEGRVEDAEKLFSRLKDGCFGLPNLITYKTMINGYSREDNLQKALSVFEEMLNGKITVDGMLYETIINGLCSHGRIKDTLTYLNIMIESGYFVSSIKLKVLFHSMFFRGGHRVSV
ncbi:hypothetical protein NMG60_11016664 [Bertholletia excelsa]